VTGLCVLDHRGGQTRRAIDGLWLCQSDIDQLERLIRDMPHRYAQLARAHSIPGRGADPVSGSSSEPLPINPAAAEHRHQIRHDLIWWCVHVADERGISRPADGEPTTTAVWLHHHVNWLGADRPSAEECLPVMRQLAGRAWAIIDPDGRKRIKIGPCVTADCDGTLYATVRADDDPRSSVIYCDTCQLEKEPLEWLRFGRTYERAS
jgi:hypothetical protein